MRKSLKKKSFVSVSVCRCVEKLFGVFLLLGERLSFFIPCDRVMTSYMAVEVLERRLAARDKELKEQLERIDQLESELSQRDALVRQLRADLDKCQQVLKPLNQVQPGEMAALSMSVVAPSLVVSNEMAEIAPWRLTNKNCQPAVLEPRFKRLAISAEPLALPRSLLLANAAELKQSLPVNRQPKSAQ